MGGKNSRPQEQAAVATRQDNIKVNRLVIVTSLACGHCGTFKQQILPKLNDNYRSNYNLEIVHVDISTMNKNTIHRESKIKLPTNLPDFVRWYPFIMMIPASAWDSDEPLVDGQTIHWYDAQAKGMGIENMKLWINTNLNTPAYNVKSDARNVKFAGNAKQSRPEPVEPTKASSAPQYVKPHGDTRESFTPKGPTQKYDKKQTETKSSINTLSIKFVPRS